MSVSPHPHRHVMVLIFSMMWSRPCVCSSLFWKKDRHTTKPYAGAMGVRSAWPQWHRRNIPWISGRTVGELTTSIQLMNSCLGWANLLPVYSRCVFHLALDCNAHTSSNWPRSRPRLYIDVYRHQYFLRDVEILLSDIQTFGLCAWTSRSFHW